LALASALAKISGEAQRIPNPVSERVPAAAQLYIVPAGLRSMFSTHPDTGDRIAALQDIAQHMGQPSVMSQTSDMAHDDWATAQVHRHKGSKGHGVSVPKSAANNRKKARPSSALDPLRRD
jgi:heat shock protein HtpX